MTDLVREDLDDAVRSFDHWDPAGAIDPYPLLRAMREECPVGHSDKHGGFWVYSRFEDVSNAMRDHATYSSTTIAIPKQAPGSILAVPPLDQDPPDHTRYRQLLLPFFTPQRTAKLEPVARETARNLLAARIGKGSCEGVADYCFPMPTVVVGAVLGVPFSDQDMFCEWLARIVEGGGTDPAGAREANAQIYAYLGGLLDERRREPRDDMLTFLLSAELVGETLTDAQRLGIATLLLIAGIDTTANTMGMALWHVAQDPDTQRQLREDAALMPSAVEEFLRVFSPVSIARITTDAVSPSGCPIGQGQQVLLSLPSANRDERKFPNAEEVILDREPNPHLGFGLGIHRCLGAHIARMELRVGLEEFIAAVPEFRLADPDAVTWKAGPIRGPKQFEIVF